MIEYSMIDDVTEALYGTFVNDGIIVESNRGLVCIPRQCMMAIFKQIVTDRYHQQLTEAAADKDAMADLQILLWKIKKEKEK